MGQTQIATQVKKNKIEKKNLGGTQGYYVYLSSKVVQQKMVRHVFFHFDTMAYHIALVLQLIVINYGALLRLMLMEITLMDNGETVTATVEQVKPVLFH